jgi:hypothetical protein
LKVVGIQLKVVATTKVVKTEMLPTSYCMDLKG